MGRMLLQSVARHRNTVLAGGVGSRGSALIGKDLGSLAGLEPNGLAVSDDPDGLFTISDVVIDFTTAASLPQHAELAAQYRRALVVGTTGLDAAAIAKLDAAARQAAILRSANMSLGVTLLTALVRQVAARLGPDAFDIEITEMHHRHKTDAPSGTALALAEAAAAGREVVLESVWRKSRDGQIGPRPAGQIGLASLRGGDVVGDHQVIFAGLGERLELGHKASSRQIFADGAVRAALWLADQPAGLYDMNDVLGV
jgi:4-hydroxy-tetrahydrodipicolinate reductase